MQIRCPHCRNPIEVVEEDPSGDVSCPSCGSCFNLAKDVETGRHLGAGRMLGHFQLLDRLGQGAFGEVWKARDTQLDRIVAVKIPRRQNLTEAETEQFLREARSAAQVRHPNIVSVHEVGRENGQIYIASDFIDGATLDEWIQAHPMSVRESVELCATIAEALHQAHEAGVVHRDLKPQNILVQSAERQDLKGEARTPQDESQGPTKSGATLTDSALANQPPAANKTAPRAQQSSTVGGWAPRRAPQTSSLVPFITDFGLAKRDAGEITMTVEGVILGTPAYMPPEQARGEAHQADRRSDVYSLGVILFRLLTGELPFRGQLQMLMVQIQNEEPPELRKLDARIPRDVETICLKCLEKDPARRYQSAAELAADLRRWLTGHPIKARPVSRLERAWRWCRRNSAIASLSAAIVIVLLTGIAVSSSFAIKANQALLRYRKADLERLLVARPMNVPEAIEQLRPNKDWALPQLRKLVADDRVDFLEKFHAALAQSEFSETDWPFLIASLEKLPSAEIANLQRVMLKHPQTAGQQLQSAFSQNESDVLRGVKAASILFCLGRLDEAQDWFLAPGKTDRRTYFVHHLSEWLGEPDGFSSRLLKVKEPRLLAMLCLTLGNSGRNRFPIEEQQHIDNALQRRWHDSPSGGVHSAVDWTIRQWKANAPRPLEEERREDSQRGWYVNSLGMTMITVNPGQFVRRDRADFGGTENTVRLSRPYWVASTEVTRAQYEQFVTKNSETLRDEEWTAVDAKISPEPTCPAQNVTWHLAIEFCNWLSRQENLSPCYRRTATDVEWDATANGYRLPTEAEWEFACRAGSTEMFSFGNDQVLLSRYAWIGDSVQERAHPVGNLLPNGSGLFDIHGNVWEWCWDIFDRYSPGDQTDPRGAEIRSGTRVIRGGGWIELTDRAASGYRDSELERNPHSAIGFRVARNRVERADTTKE